MHRSECDSPRSMARSVDWRGWLILAWVLWFGVLYGKMVVESRGHRVRELVPQVQTTPDPRTLHSQRIFLLSCSRTSNGTSLDCLKPGGMAQLRGDLRAR